MVQVVAEQELRVMVQMLLEPQEVQVDLAVVVAVEELLVAPAAQELSTYGIRSEL